MKKVASIIFLLLLLSRINGQTGGDNTYEFLNLTHSGLVSSLGGSNVSLYGNNINLTLHNPALLNGNMSNYLALDYVNYLAGVNYGLALYSWPLLPKGNIAGGITFFNYGSFTEADETGEITGTFVASEFSFPIFYSRDIDSLFTIGVTFKPVLSHLEKYTSFGFAVDLGISYRSETGLFSTGLVIRNIGMQVTRYASEERMKLPFEIETGVTQRLAHAPFRFSATFRHLEKYNLLSDDEEVDPVNSFIAGSRFIDNIFRHLIVGAELIPHENFYLSSGFNYLRRKELGIDTKMSSVGFSWGFGINSSYLDIEFGRANYHLAGASTHISMILKLEKLYDR